MHESLTASGVDGAHLTGTVRSTGPSPTGPSPTGPSPTGTVRFRTGNGIDLGEAPLGASRHVGFQDFAAGDGTAVAEYFGDLRHAPSTSLPERLPEVPAPDGPPEGEA